MWVRAIKAYDAVLKGNNQVYSVSLQVALNGVHFASTVVKVSCR